MLRTGTFRRELTIPLQAIQSELNRMFEDYWTPNRPSAGPASSSATRAEPSSWSPSVDVLEMADTYQVSVEVPGVDPATIELSVTGNVLSLKGSKPLEAGDNTTGNMLRERKFGPFARQVVLPGEVNLDGAEAEARNGVLKVRLRKQEVAKPRTIPVQSL